MNTLSRNQRSLMEASQIGKLFGDGLENGDRDGDLEEDLPEGVNVENCDYMITSCVNDCKQDRERPLTSRESQSISLKQ